MRKQALVSIIVCTGMYRPKNELFGRRNGWMWIKNDMNISWEKHTSPIVCLIFLKYFYSHLTQESEAYIPLDNGSWRYSFVAPVFWSLEGSDGWACRKCLKWFLKAITYRNTLEETYWHREINDKWVLWNEKWKRNWTRESKHWKKHM